MIRSLIAPFAGKAKKHQRSRLRSVMRGYQALKRSGRLDRIASVKQTLTEHSQDLLSQDFSPVLMGQGVESGELIVRQYLLALVGGINLNRALLLALASVRSQVVFPLPREWRAVLVGHGFEVAHLRSAVLWHLYVCGLLFYGVLRIGKIALAGITSAKLSGAEPKGYVYFADLGPGNLPQKGQKYQGDDVVSWYLQWPGRKLDIEAIHHSATNSLPFTVGKIGIIPQRGPLPALVGRGAVSTFLCWGFHAIAIAAVDFLRGRWWHPLLLNQAALAAQARMLPANFLAREYLFHNSGWIYRPLWTYEAERRGCTVSFYFYSTNCEAFRRSDEYPPMPYGWKAMNWPHYLVWDKYQADFVRRAVGDGPSLSVVGNIWFQRSAAEMPTLPHRSVAVFDVQPVRESYYRTLGLDLEYYTPVVANQFLEDVSNAVRRSGVAMAWKRKRNIGRLAHPHYRNWANELAESGHVVLVDPDIAATRVIESSVAVISMPFTSTALVAREMGKPSIYYDPTGLLQRDDRAAHGIPILCGADELDAWLAAQTSTHMPERILSRTT